MTQMEKLRATMAKKMEQSTLRGELSSSGISTGSTGSSSASSGSTSAGTSGVIQKAEEVIASSPLSSRTEVQELLAKRTQARQEIEQKKEELSGVRNITPSNVPVVTKWSGTLTVKSNAEGAEATVMDGPTKIVKTLSNKEAVFTVDYWGAKTISAKYKEQLKDGITSNVFNDETLSDIINIEFQVSGLGGAIDLGDTGYGFDSSSNGSSATAYPSTYTLMVYSYFGAVVKVESINGYNTANVNVSGTINVSAYSDSLVPSKGFGYITFDVPRSGFYKITTICTNTDGSTAEAYGIAFMPNTNKDGTVRTYWQTYFVFPDSVRMALSFGNNKTTWDSVDTCTLKISKGDLAYSGVGVKSTYYDSNAKKYYYYFVYRFYVTDEFLDTYDEETHPCDGSASYLQRGIDSGERLFKCQAKYEIDDKQYIKSVFLCQDVLAVGDGIINDYEVNGNISHDSTPEDANPDRILPKKIKKTFDYKIKFKLKANKTSISYSNGVRTAGAILCPENRYIAQYKKGTFLFNYSPDGELTGEISYNENDVIALYCSWFTSDSYGLLVPGKPLTAMYSFILTAADNGTVKEVNFTIPDE